MTEGLAVKTIKLLNKGTEICDVELINYSNEQIPFNMYVVTCTIIIIIIIIIILAISI